MFDRKEIWLVSGTLRVGGRYGCAERGELLTAETHMG